MDWLIFLVAAIGLAVAAYLVREQRRHGADMAARGGLDRRQLLVMSLVPLSFGIVETILFTDDGANGRLLFGAVGYLLAAWLITRAFANNNR